MKSLPLQMQQNLILAATLIGGVLFVPQTITKPLAEGAVTLSRTAHAKASYGTASSFSKRPETETWRRIGAAGISGQDAFEIVPARLQPDVTNFVPQSVQGEWVSNSSSSMSASTLEDEVTESRFSFLIDGRYSYVYAVRQRSHGRALTSTTVEEGIVSFKKGGTFVMSPDHGYFQGNSEGGFVSRALDAAELGARIFHWEWRTESGKKFLYLGPSAKAASLYTRNRQA